MMDEANATDGPSTPLPAFSSFDVLDVASATPPGSQSSGLASEAEDLAGARVPVANGGSGCKSRSPLEGSPLLRAAPGQQADPLWRSP